MFNVGGPEILVILVIALLVLGPDQLPKAMRTIGNAQAQIKKVSGGFRDEIQKAVSSIEPEPEPKAGPAIAKSAAATLATAATRPAGAATVTGERTPDPEGAPTAGKPSATAAEATPAKDPAPQAGPAGRVPVDAKELAPVGPADRAAG